MEIKKIRNNRYVTIPKDEFESMRATIETLGDDKVLKQIEESKGASSKSLKQLKKEKGLSQ